MLAQANGARIWNVSRFSLKERRKRREFFWTIVNLLNRWANITQFSKGPICGQEEKRELFEDVSISGHQETPRNQPTSGYTLTRIQKPLTTFKTEYNIQLKEFYHASHLLLTELTLFAHKQTHRVRAAGMWEQKFLYLANKLAPIFILILARQLPSWKGRGSGNDTDQARKQPQRHILFCPEANQYKLSHSFVLSSVM